MRPFKGAGFLFAAVLLPSFALADPAFTHVNAGVRIDDQSKSQMQNGPFGNAVSASTGDTKTSAGAIAASAGSFASASLGKLQVATSAFSSDQFSNSASGAIAGFDFLDLVISGPGTAAIPVSFNLVVNGSITAEQYVAAFAGTNGSLDLVSAVHTCPSCATEVVNGRVNVGIADADPTLPVSGHAVTFGSGQFAGYHGGTTTITSAPFMATPGSTFDMSMLAQAHLINVVGATMNIFFLATRSASRPAARYSTCRRAIR